VSCIYFQILCTLDTGSARSSLPSTGKGLQGYIIFIMDYFDGTFTSYHLWTLITWSWGYILLQVDVASAGHYYDDIDITQWKYILDLLHTSHSNKTISSSDVAIDLCLYILWDTLRTNLHN